MWKDYSKSFIKKNRASSVSIMVAAFIATLLLSFLCSSFYSMWVYEMESIVLEEGDWQGRITGELDHLDLMTIQNFANVETAQVNEALSDEAELVVDITFENARTIFRDMPVLVERLALGEDAASYHLLLLSRYLIHDPQDENPPLLLTFYLVILLMVSFSLILIIRNSFAVSMNARVHQFGIFSSIGATPAQIRVCLMQEAAVLCLLPVLLGCGVGMVLSNGVNGAMELIGKDIPGRHISTFHYHPAVVAGTILFSGLTVLISAWMPAWKLSRLTPLESIRNPGGKGPKRKRHSHVLALLFGIEGEMAGNALNAQRKALRTSTLSLSLSFLGFSMMLSFFSLSDLSRKYTYFERYQDKWDIMVTVNHTGIEDFGRIDELHELEGVRDCAVYQKTEAVSLIPEKWMSGELMAVGGPGALAGSSASKKEDTWSVNAPMVILDDAAFQTYCEQVGIAYQPGGTIILNRIWDSSNSNFRYPIYVPFLNEQMDAVALQNPDGKGTVVEVPVLGFAQKGPDLKEEYDNKSLVQFIPLSLWEQISERMDVGKADTWIRILGKEGMALEDLNLLEEDVIRLAGQSYEIESENRLEELMLDKRMIWGYELIVGAFCYLLAAIGLANVFSFTRSFMHQRKREFAQYRSVGMTPAGMCKLFCIEALVIAGRPILITLPLTAAFVVYLTKASFLKLSEVLPEIPVLQIVFFHVVIVVFVALAYYLGGRRAMKNSLVEALRDDTMV